MLIYADLSQDNQKNNLLGKNNALIFSFSEWKHLDGVPLLAFAIQHDRSSHGPKDIQTPKVTVSHQFNRNCCSGYTSPYSILMNDIISYCVGDHPTN